MKTTILLLALVGLTGCAASPAVAVSPLPPPSSAVLTPEDVRAKPDAVPEGESRQVARSSFPGATVDCTDSDEDSRDEVWISSSVRGSFTAPNLVETMYSAQLSKCNDLPSSPKSRFLLVYLGGREVWRTSAPEAVRATDVDGDGQDEWVEVYSQCRGECTTEAWLQGYVRGEAVTLAHSGM
jgi:hypothetical protein